MKTVLFIDFRLILKSEANPHALGCFVYMPVIIMISFCPEESIE